VDRATPPGYGEAMSDEDREQAASPEEPAPDTEEEEEEEDGPPSTPFDHPAFLPVLLGAFALWFGYDGWFNPEMEWVKFNRYGFAILAVAAIYYTVRALRERRSSESDPDSR
jgi:hypothetical protein